MESERHSWVNSVQKYILFVLRAHCTSKAGMRFRPLPVKHRVFCTSPYAISRCDMHQSGCINKTQTMLGFSLVLGFFFF